MGLSLSANLTKSFKKLALELKSANERVIKKTIVNTHNQIILFSPVKTGYYRANNFVEVGSNGTRSPIAQDKESYRPNSISDADTLKVEFKKGNKYVLYNPVPYAQDLEGGRSDQAPNGVYLPASNTVKAFIKKQGDEYKKIKWDLK